MTITVGDPFFQPKMDEPSKEIIRQKTLELQQKILNLADQGE
jgi:hypothetical protein